LRISIGRKNFLRRAIAAERAVGVSIASNFSRWTSQVLRALLGISRVAEMRWRLTICFGFAAALGFSLQAAAQTAQSLKDLLRARSCGISAQLRAVYERPSAVKERDRFFVISVTSDPQRYVQCMFAEDRPKLFCEASNGGRARARSEETKAVLRRLGFSTETADKNFTYEKDLTREPDFDAITTLMLTALHDGYGVRADTELTVDAPFRGRLITVCRY
jgi:hypothetical protein